MTAQSWWGAELLDHGAPDAVFARAAREVTFGELRVEVEWLSETLSRHGIRTGNTVALQGTPSFTHLWSIFALWSLGAQVLLFEPGVRGQERAALLEMCAPQFFVSFGGLCRQTDRFIDQCEVLVRRMPGSQPGHFSHCVVQFSSGTTGRRPKAIGRTSESLLVELDRLRTLNGMPQAGERVAVLGSVTHSFGLIGGLLYALGTGATAVFPTAQTPRAIAEAAALAHVVIGNPRHFDQLVHAADEVALPDMRLAVSGGEALSREVYQTFARRYGVSIGQAYGTTETGIIATDLAGMFGTPTIGLPVQGVRTRVVDGVLEAHLPQSPYLYQGLPWSGGWMSTHDLVTRDPETGALRLRGRVDDHGHAHGDLVEIQAVPRARARHQGDRARRVASAANQTELSCSLMNDTRQDPAADAGNRNPVRSTTQMAYWRRADTKNPFRSSSPQAAARTSSTADPRALSRTPGAIASRRRETERPGLRMNRIVAEAARIAVVGAGMAGLIVATILRRRGVHCDVFERSSALDAVGAGIQLSPNGVRILHRLGLTAALAEDGVKAQAIETRRWDDGSLIARTPYGPECEELFGAPYYMVHRADLQRCLVGALSADGAVQLGQLCTRVVELPDHVELHFANGAVTTADLVIGADGVHSVVRDAVVQDEPKFSGYSVHRGIVSANQEPSFSNEPKVLFWLGPGHHVTYYPISAGRTIHFSAVCFTDDERSGSWTTGADTGDLSVAFAGWHDDVRRVVTAAQSVTRWGLFDRDIVERYGTDRVVLVGDAAHPMLPYMSQGASQALEDAVVLADCLGDCAQRDLARAVRRYEMLRKPRTAEIHRQSRIRGETFHLADGPRQRDRDATMLRTQNLSHLDWVYGYEAELAAKNGSTQGDFRRVDQSSKAHRFPATPRRRESV